MPKKITVSGPRGGFHKLLVIDGKGHIMGRLASTIAKQLLEGQKIVVVRVEEIVISGPHFQSFLRKTCNTNPRRGPVHYRTPSKMFWRTVRGMLPHKTKRGAAALERLSVFEGIPPSYEKVRRVVVPRCLSVCRWKPQTKHTVLGELAKEVGWKYSSVVARLNAKRQVRAAAYWKHKVALRRLANIAERVALPKVKDLNKQLNKLGRVYQE